MLMARALIGFGITMMVAATLVGSSVAQVMASVQSPRTGAVIGGTSSERVKIVDFAFRPKTITVAKGTRVRWTNRGDTRHTTTSTRGLWDSGVLAVGDSFSRVFRKTGTFRYHCTIHSTMRGRIVVT
jgi:plastocyanin